jgi:hypothetical protein
MHHKKKRPRIAACGLCKPHKTNGACPRHRDMRMGNLRRYQAATAQIRCEGLKG